MALEKKSGGIRPIAIGYTWRRIAAKCAIAHATAVYVRATCNGIRTFRPLTSSPQRRFTPSVDDSPPRRYWSGDETSRNPCNHCNLESAHRSAVRQHCTLQDVSSSPSMPVGHCVVKLDFSNVFNSLHRDAMLAAVKQSCRHLQVLSPRLRPAVSLSLRY